MAAYLRGQVVAHPEQGPTIRRVRLALRLSLADVALLLGLSERNGRRHVKRLQAGTKCASGRLADRFYRLFREPLPMPPDPMAPKRQASALRKQAWAVRQAAREADRQARLHPPPPVIVNGW
jgi:hypothetical protein